MRLYRLIAELSTQTADMHIERSVANNHLSAPNLSEYLLSCKDLARLGEVVGVDGIALVLHGVHLAGEQVARLNHADEEHIRAHHVLAVFVLLNHVGDAAQVGSLRTVIWGAWDIGMKL